MAIGNPEFPPQRGETPTFRLRHPSIGSHYLDEYDDEYEENKYEKDDENEDQYRNDLDLQVLDS